MQSNQGADRQSAQITVLNTPPPTTTDITYADDGLYRLTRAAYSSGETFDLRRVRRGEPSRLIQQSIPRRAAAHCLKMTGRYTALPPAKISPRAGTSSPSAVKV